MTKAEQVRMRRLELENAELREWQRMHLRIYREYAEELIELRAERELIREIMGCANTAGSSPKQ